MIGCGHLKTDIVIIQNVDVTKRLTRQSELLRLPNFSTSKAQSSTLYYGIKNFNEFLTFLKTKNYTLQSIRLSEFKLILKKYVSAS